MIAHADWMLAALSLTAGWLMGSRKREAWAYTLFVNAAGMAYFAHTGQDGLVALEAAFVVINARGWWAWRPQRPGVDDLLAAALEHHAPDGVATRYAQQVADARHANRPGGSA